MQKPVQITERGLNLPDATKDRILKRAEGLERYDPRITSCHVICETPHRRRNSGTVYNIRIELGVPGKALVVTRQGKEDFNAAIREAFDAARRELEDAVRERDQRVKQHDSEQAAGKVARLFPNLGYGFIETADGREVYFHRNSVLHGSFERLKEGAKVHFAEEMGDKGPQASSVKVAGHS